MLVAAAAMTFASCQREEMNAPKETFSTTLTLNTEVETTKTYLGAGNTVFWGENESVALFVKDSNGEPATTFVNSTATSDFNGKASASFTFELKGIAESDSYTIGGIYPASASNIDNNKNAAAYKVALPATQNASINNYDPSAFIMVLKPETVKDVPSTYTAWFRRAVALNKITLTGVKENISSVEITVEPSQKGLYLAGRRYVNLTTAEFGEIYYGMTNTVTVNAPYTGSSIDVWFTSWGMELKPGDKLTVKMTSATKIYTRTITANENGITFVEGDLNTLKVNMASAEEEVLNNLSGKYLVAAKKGDNWALMAPTATDFINALTTSVAYTNKECASFYEVVGIDDYVWTVTAIDGGYSVCSYDGKYVSFPKDGKNNAELVDSPASLSLDIDDAHKATVTDMGSGRVLKYNASSPRFAFYESGQTDIYFIPWVADTTPRIFVTSAHEQSIGADGGEVKFEYTLKNLPSQSLTVEETSDFVSASVAAGVVTATVSANTTTESRKATLTLKCGEAAPVSVTIIQDGKQAAGEPTEITDVLTPSVIGISGSSYTAWSNKKLESLAVYAGNSSAGTGIQLKSNGSTSGIITTSSGGTVSKIIVKWHSSTTAGRTLDIYGKSTAYTAPSDLYGSNDKGTKIGSIVKGTSTELVVDGEYQFIGLRSNNGAMYLEEIQIVWESGNTGGNTTDPETPGGGGETPTPEPEEPETPVDPTPDPEGTTNFAFTSANEVTQNGITVRVSKGSGSTAPAYYSSGLRLYAKNTIVVSSEVNITRVEYVFSKQGSKDYATASGDAIYTSGGTSSNENTPVTDVWTGSSKEITVTLGSSGQRILKSLTVYTD